MKYKVKQCPFCNECNLKIFKADDRSFCYVACANKDCLALGPMAEAQDIMKGEQYPIMKHLKEYAVKRWNQRKYSNFVELKEITIRSFSHDIMMGC